jgi:predicted membrane metal-binding protein
LERIAETPPLYLVTLALVIGDGAGNCGVFVPLWIVALLGVTAGLLMLAPAGRAAGVVLTVFALIAVSTAPVHRLIDPPAGPATLARFPDDSMITVEGTLTRPTERVEGARDLVHLFLKVDRARLPDAELTPAYGLIRVTTAETSTPFRLGDDLRVTARLRFPRNDRNPGEFDYRDWLLRQGIVATMFATPTKSNPRAVAKIGHHDFLLASPIERVREHMVR